MFYRKKHIAMHIERRDRTSANSACPVSFFFVPRLFLRPNIFKNHEPTRHQNVLLNEGFDEFSRMNAG